MSEVYSYNKLYTAYLDCRKNKRNTINALEFEMELEKNIFDLQIELKSSKYSPSRSICFAVTEPSPREIFAAEFKDRVVHHFLVNELKAKGEKMFIHDSFACRKNKGTHVAINQLKKFIRKITDNNRQEAYFAQLDISGFFMSIDHKILYNIIKEMIESYEKKSVEWKREILNLAKIIIFHKPTENYCLKGNPLLLKLIPPEKSLFNSGENKGLPIGNYSSQFFTSLYLNRLDHFVKRTLKCKYYIRYMDDFILLDKDRNKLEKHKDKINFFLNENLAMELKDNKTKIQPLSKGIDFLGYFTKPDYSLVRRRVVKNLRNKLEEDKFKDLEKTLSVVNSYFGHFCRANGHGLKQSIFIKHFFQKAGDKIRFSKNNQYLVFIKNKAQDAI